MLNHTILIYKCTFSFPLTLALSRQGEREIFAPSPLMGEGRDGGLNFNA